MIQSFTYLITGIVLGLSAGISPGPLLTLVISQTLKFGKKEGIKIAVAPLITDFALILLTVFILTRLSNFHIILGVISLVGGIFLLYLAYENITIRGFDLNSKEIRINSLKNGVIANILNPHPYLFWFSIGGPIILKGYNTNPMLPVLFILGFYICLVGSKIAIALAVGKSRNFLRRNLYLYTIKVLGILLAVFAVIFVKDALMNLLGDKIG